jgi:hypothetical protein
MHGVLIGEKCPSCSRFVSALEMLRFGLGGCVRMCIRCYGHHRHRLAGLAAQNPPEACHGCSTPFEELPKDAGGNSRMYIHEKDGIYQVLCLRCSDAYERKRPDLYRSTPYGHERKI